MEYQLIIVDFESNLSMLLLLFSNQTSSHIRHFWELLIQYTVHFEKYVIFQNSVKLVDLAVRTAPGAAPCLRCCSFLNFIVKGKQLTLNIVEDARIVGDMSLKLQLILMLLLAMPIESSFQHCFFAVLTSFSNFVIS